MLQKRFTVNKILKSTILVCALISIGLSQTENKLQAELSIIENLNGPKILNIDLDCTAKVAGVSEEAFQEYAAKAKAGCPISRLFTGTEINLTAKLG